MDRSYPYDYRKFILNNTFPVIIGVHCTLGTAETETLSDTLCTAVPTQTHTEPGFRAR